jgi:cytochrome b subunit of formate dehydrogenase
MTPKIPPSLLMAAGSLMLAWRMKYLLDALMRAQLGAETHFRSITEFLAGRQTELPTLVAFNQHVARTQKIGVWLSVLGFVMIGVSGLLNAYLLWAGL